ncbi:MAG: hypothetical protein DRR42_21810 [Gammaproteobacteria bacterium]|nr:MAG: hypothetical protein DRR42_21810 [Gammaproteobacteria bacterium]
MKSTLETFIRPVELSRKSLCLGSSIFNAYRLLISRDADGFVFLPLRNIQFQAIVSSDEILFVDSFGPYHSDVKTGGRCISFAWQFSDIKQRNSITHSADYEFVRYCDHSDVDNNRLVSEFSCALEYHRQNQLSLEQQNRSANIINLSQ